MNVPSEVWTKILSLMEADMTATTIQTWFGDARAVSLDEDTFILCSPSEFKRGIISTRYIAAIQKALHELFSADFEVKVVDENYEKQDHSAKTDTSFLPGSEDYTFDRFVVGSSNKFAHAAARAVAEAPGTGYNPLFIWGESGLGKTHLMYAIAHEVHRQHPDYRIVYIKGDSFTNELIQAIRDRTQAQFHDKYRNADLFLMDDVQFIAGRESTQEEMFHTFNTLRDAKKQIVFTADRPPKDILRLDERLETRFSHGLLAKIDPPDYETRVAILKNKAIRMGLELPEPVLKYVAENITANVRQLEGTINKILAFQSLLGEDVDVETVTRAVRDILRDKSDILPSASVIIEEVCKFYSIENDTLRGQSRGGKTLQARQVAMYLIRRMTSLSLNEIGQEFGNRDHGTVHNSIKKMENAMKIDPELGEIIKDITTNVNARYE